MTQTTLPKFNHAELRLIYDAVRRYQQEKTIIDSNEYWRCSDILDEMFDVVYTQVRERTT